MITLSTNKSTQEHIVKVDGQERVRQHLLQS